MPKKNLARGDGLPKPDQHSELPRVSPVSGRVHLYCGQGGSQHHYFQKAKEANLNCPDCRIAEHVYAVSTEAENILTEEGAMIAADGDLIPDSARDEILELRRRASKAEHENEELVRINKTQQELIEIRDEDIADWCESHHTQKAEIQRLTDALTILRTALNIEHMRANLHATFNGGHHENEAAMAAFHHGMDTVCNVLDAYQKGEQTNGILPRQRLEDAQSLDAVDPQV